MRRNAPRLIDPKNDAMRHTDHQLGIELPMEHGDRLSEVERQIADLNWQVQNLRSRLQVVEPFAFASPGILTTFNLKGSVTATNITGTTTVTNSNIGPLIAGMPYLVIAIAHRSGWHHRRRHANADHVRRTGRHGDRLQDRCWHRRVYQYRGPGAGHIRNRHSVRRDQCGDCDPARRDGCGVSVMTRKGENNE
jgi:hypothetical protein